MSKTLAPGLRLGYIVASAELIAELRALRRFMLRHPPANNQRAVALFLSLGHHEALVRRLSAASTSGASGWSRRSRPSCRSGARPIRPAARRSGSKGRAAPTRAAWPTPRRARSVIIEAGDRFFDRIDKPTRFMRLGISSIALQHIEPGIRELATAAGQASGGSLNT